jgi:hypothetical protein
MCGFERTREWDVGWKAHAAGDAITIGEAI